MGVFKRLAGLGVRPRRDAEGTVYLDQKGVKQFEDDITKLIKKLTNVTVRKEVLNDAGRIVRDKARELTPKAQPRIRDKKLRRETSPVKLKPDVLYTYQETKGFKRGKGKGIVNGKYGLGNLKLSINVLNDVKKIKAPVSIIGPWINKQKSIVKPSEKRSNGWYAHIIYGSAENFGKKVTFAALNMSGAFVFNNISNGVLKLINKEVKTNQIIR